MQPRGREPRDDAAFWRDLQDTFESALDLLQEIAETHGIDPSLASPDDIRKREVQLDEAARSHPLALAASDYAWLVNDWFREAQEGIHAWGREVTRAAEARSAGSELEQDVMEMQEAVEVIASERHRIQVKVMRALRERLRGGNGEPTAEGSSAWLMPGVKGTGETGGAAREALDGVQRSIDMWLRMRALFPNEEDAILHLLVHLERMRNDILEIFSIAPAETPARDR